MSPSDPLDGAAAGVSPAQLRTIIGAAVRLYAASCEAAGEELAPIERDVSTTEAMTLACALVRSQNLNAFDFAMWFSRGK
ncbi:MAG TPA: hypothetical protein VKU01_13080 [Bryobacteraceae bacterium]|nr:hypothetical protein [Bryobacteraceae bacterium]